MADATTTAGPGPTPPPADPVPFEVQVGEAVRAAYAGEKDHKAGVQKAAEVILRAAPESWVKAGALTQLPGRDGRPVAALVGLRSKGYVTVILTDSGTTHVYRILKFKPAADGGNDYVPIDSWEPLIAD